LAELFAVANIFTMPDFDTGEMVARKEDGSRTIMRDPSLLSADAKRLTALPAGHPEGYFDAFVSFMRDVEQAVNGQLPSGLPVFEDGARAAVLTEAVLLSAAHGTWVDVR
jgi:predicted dehydrogenase